MTDRDRAKERNWQRYDRRKETKNDSSRQVGMVEDRWGTETVREVKTNWNRAISRRIYIRFSTGGRISSRKAFED